MCPDDFYFRSHDGIPQEDPGSYWHYRFNLMLDAVSAMQGFLELLIAYNQKRKLTHFLLFCCDQLEITYDRHTEALQEYRFQVHFSDRISLHYSSCIHDCFVFLDGKKDCFPTFTPDVMDTMSQILVQIWEDIRTLPIWVIVAEDTHILRVIRSSSQYPVS